MIQQIYAVGSVCVNFTAIGTLGIEHSARGNSYADYFGRFVRRGLEDFVDPRREAALLAPALLALHIRAHRRLFIVCDADQTAAAEPAPLSGRRTCGDQTHQQERGGAGSREPVRNTTGAMQVSMIGHIGYDKSHSSQQPELMGCLLVSDAAGVGAREQAVRAGKLAPAAARPFTIISGESVVQNQSCRTV